MGVMELEVIPANDKGKEVGFIWPVLSLKFDGLKILAHDIYNKYNPLYLM